MSVIKADGREAIKKYTLLFPNVFNTMLGNTSQ